MTVMGNLTLQERKRSKNGEPNIAQVDRRRIDGYDDREKHQINEVAV